MHRYQDSSLSFGKTQFNLLQMLKQPKGSQTLSFYSQGAVEGKPLGEGAKAEAAVSYFWKSNQFSLINPSSQHVVSMWTEKRKSEIQSGKAKI